MLGGAGAGPLLESAAGSYFPLIPSTAPVRPSANTRPGFRASIPRNDPVRKYARSLGTSNIFADGWFEIDARSREAVWDVCEGHPKVETVLNKLHSDITNGGLEIQIEEAGMKRKLDEMVKAGVISIDYQQNLLRDIIKHTYFSGYVLISIEGDSTVMPKTKVPVVISRHQYSVMMRFTAKGREFRAVSTEGLASGIGGARVSSSVKGGTNLMGEEFPRFKNMAGVKKQLFYCPYPPTDEGFVNSPLSKTLKTLVQMDHVTDDFGYSSFWRSRRGCAFTYQANQKDASEAWESSVWSRNDSEEILNEYHRRQDGNARGDLMDTVEEAVARNTGVSGNGAAASSGKRVMARKEAITRGLATGNEGTLGSISQYPNAHSMFPPEEHAIYLNPNQGIEPLPVPEVMPQYVERLHQLVAEFYTDLGMPPALMDTAATNFAGDAQLVFKNYDLKIKNLQHQYASILGDLVSVLWRKDHYKTYITSAYEARFGKKAKKARSVEAEDDTPKRELPPPGLSNAFLTGWASKESPSLVKGSTINTTTEEEAQRRIQTQRKLAQMGQTSEASTTRALKRKGAIQAEETEGGTPPYIAKIEDPWDGNAREYVKQLKKALDEELRNSAVSPPSENRDLRIKMTSELIAAQGIDKQKARRRATKKVVDSNVRIEAYFNHSPTMDFANLLQYYINGVINRQIFNEHAGRMAGFPSSQINSAADSEAQEQAAFDTRMKQSEAQLKQQRDFAEPDKGSGAPGKPGQSGGGGGLKLPPFPPASKPAPKPAPASSK